MVRDATCFLEIRRRVGGEEAQRRLGTVQKNGFDPTRYRAVVELELARFRIVDQARRRGLVADEHEAMRQAMFQEDTVLAAGPCTARDAHQQVQEQEAMEHFQRSEAYPIAV